MDESSRTVLARLSAWCRQGRRCAVAVVVGATGSVPRPLGTIMGFADDGAVVGSVSGGCVEADLYHVAGEVMDGSGPQLRRYSVDGDVTGIGLMCGGTIEVVVVTPSERDAAALVAIATEVAAARPVGLAVVANPGPLLGAMVAVGADSVWGSIGRRALDTAVGAVAGRELECGESAVHHFGLDGDCAGSDLRILVSSFSTPAHLIVVGANDFAAALVRAGKTVGYRVTLCDPRPAFASAARFPDVDEVVVSWPDVYLREVAISASTMICVLTHDPRFDIPALDVALRSAAGFVGAMGSRRTHADRLERLRDVGIDDSALARLHSPIGLDLGAATPPETAISILAEIVASRRGGSGAALSEQSGPIHRSSHVLIA